MNGSLLTGLLQAGLAKSGLALVKAQVSRCPVFCEDLRIPFAKDWLLICNDACTTLPDKGMWQA